MENFEKDKVTVNGVIYNIVGSIENPIDITDNSVKPTNIVPGYYKIKMHENVGNQILTVKILNSVVLNDTLMITLSDNYEDYMEILYWNGGWKFNRELVDTIEDWLSWYDLSIDNNYDN